MKTKYNKEKGAVDKSPTKEQVTEWVTFINDSLSGAPDESWYKFFKKKFGLDNKGSDILAKHLMQNHAYLPENPSPFAIRVLSKELEAHAREMTKRRVLFSGFQADEFGNVVQPSASPAIADFRQSIHEKFDFGFSSIFGLKRGLPELNKVLVKKNLELRIFDWDSDNTIIYIWIEKKGFGDGVQSLTGN